MRSTVFSVLTMPMVFCAVHTAAVASAQAKCTEGTPDANRILMDSLSPEVVSGWVSKHLEMRDGWANRGNGDVAAVHLEFSKLALAAFLIGNGVNDEDLDISQSLSGIWRYTPGQLYLNSAFHRSFDEWEDVVSDKGFTVCDFLNPISGEFQCVKEKSGGWLSTKRYRYFGFDTDTNIFDDTLGSVVAYNGGVSSGWDPETTESLYGDRPGKNRKIVYYCPMFEDDMGSADEMVLPRAVFNLVGNAWMALRDRRPKTSAQNFFFISSTSASGKREAIGRETIDHNIGQLQVAQQAVCDLAVSAQGWVPLMVTELMSQGFLDLGAEARYFNTDEGKSPFSCTMMRDPLVLTPVSSPPVSCGSVPSCNSDSDCPTQYNYCNNGCCGTIH